MSNYTYLAPPQIAYSITHQGEEIKFGVDEKQGRKIYNNVEYDNLELTHIALLEDEIQKQQIELPQDWTKIDTLKFVYVGGFNTQKSIEGVKKNISWRNNQIYHTLTLRAEELLKLGLIYQLGRDKKYRPVIYFNVPKINAHLNEIEPLIQAICYLLTLIKSTMLIPYHVENWVIILDIMYLSIISLPLKAIKHILEITNINYCSMSDQIFILNPSFVVKTGWNLLRNVIPRSGEKKIKFLDLKNKEDLQIFHDKISLDYLEQKYGGNLPNLEIYWPIPDVYTQNNQIQFHKSKSSSNPKEEFEYSPTIQMKESQYFSLESEQNFFNHFPMHQISQIEIEKQVQKAACCQTCIII